MRRTTIVVAGLAVSLSLAGGTFSQPQAQPQTQKACSPKCTKPNDPLQAVAAKALAGAFNPIPKWKRDVYQYVLDNGLTAQGTAWVTCYTPVEGFYRGKKTRSGRGVSERSAAVYRKDWPALGSYYVWTAAYGIRVVEDTGANSNHRYAINNHADRWLDYWFPKPRRGNPVTPYAFISKHRIKSRNPR